jgi:hypothetical protein
MAPTPIYGFSWGASNSGGAFGGGGAGARKVTFTDPVVHQARRRHLAGILINTATGKHIKMAKVTIYDDQARCQPHRVRRRVLRREAEREVLNAD